MIGGSPGIPPQLHGLVMDLDLSRAGSSKKTNTTPQTLHHCRAVVFPIVSNRSQLISLAALSSGNGLLLGRVKVEARLRMSQVQDI